MQSSSVGSLLKPTRSVEPWTWNAECWIQTPFAAVPTRRTSSIHEETTHVLYTPPECNSGAGWYKSPHPIPRYQCREEDPLYDDLYRTSPWPLMAATSCPHREGQFPAHHSTWCVARPLWMLLHAVHTDYHLYTTRSLWNTSIKHQF